MPCNECPETPDTGCLQPITTECVTYNGNDIDCADIASGQSLNQVIAQLANNDCQLKEDIEDINQSIVNIQTDITELSGNAVDLQEQINAIPSFSCEDLSGCSIDDLSDVEVSPTSGDSLVYNGEKWVNYTPEEVVPYQFTCEELSGCTLDELSGVAITDPASGDILINNGSNWVNQSFAALYSANNGLTKTSNNIKLGGALIENTSFSGNYDLYFGNKNYIFGDDNSLIGSTTIKFAVVANKTLGSLTSGFSTNFKNSVFTIAAGTTLSAGQGLFNDSNVLVLTTDTNKTFTNSTRTASTASYLQIKGTGTPTLTYSRNGSNIVPLSNTLVNTLLDNDTDNASNKVTVNDFANIFSNIIANNANHNAFTNFYHVLLADSNEIATPAYITNRYGIYQQGSSDKNVFFGEIEYHGALTNASDLRSKNKGESFTKGLEVIEQIIPTNFTKKEGFGATDVNHVGIIAQEIENILPEAIKIRACKDIEDFRFYDQSVLVYTLINAVKELSQKIKLLEDAIK